MGNIEIRERNSDDANEFCNFLLKLDDEAEFMLFEKGERNVSKEVIQKNIESVINDGNKCYVALDNDRIIGYIISIRENFIRTRHVAAIVVGILEEYCSKGIGQLLLKNIVDWANKSNVKRLELTVITENKRAINLYNKFGFDIEGIRKAATLKDGKYYDEFYMAKIIEGNNIE